MELEHRSLRGCVALLATLTLLTGVSASAAPAFPTTASGKPIIYLGVTYFPAYDTAIDSAELQAMIDGFGGAAYRVGATYDVQLMVHTPISWGETEKVNGSPPSFTREIAFGNLVKNKGMSWAPLLEYHSVPTWLEAAAPGSRMTRADGSLSNGSFMPFSPSSIAWSTYATRWTTAAMNALAPFFDTTIKTVLVGNEMMYDGRDATSYDPATQSRTPYAIGNSKEFLKWRSLEWANTLRLFVRTAKNAAAGRVNVATKLVPYSLIGTEMVRLGTFPHIYDVIDEEDVLSINMYPPTDREYQSLYRRSKATFVAEFNKNKAPASGDELLRWVQLGVSRYNVRYAAWFCWKCAEADGSWDWSMTPDQKDGMRRAVDWAAGVNRPFTAPTRTVSLQLSLEVLENAAAGTWQVHPYFDEKHSGAMALGKDLPAAYELDYRPRAADVQLVQVRESHRSVSPFSGKYIYLLDKEEASVVASDGSGRMRAWRGSGVSEADGVLSDPLVSGQVFGWSPAWENGARALEVSSASWSQLVRSRDGATVAARAGNSFGVVNDPVWAASTGNPATNTRVRNLIRYMFQQLSPVCSEASCTANQGMYISHFTGANCDGTELYYLPYDGYGYTCRTWNGWGLCGTVRRTMTVRSYNFAGRCYANAWSTGNTLADLVNVYR